MAGYLQRDLCADPAAVLLLLLLLSQVVFEKGQHVLATNIRKGGVWLPYILDQKQVDEERLRDFKAKYKELSCIPTTTSVNLNKTQ